MKLKLKTLTPVNVGTGLKYGYYEFILNENEIKRIHLNMFLQKLTKEQVKNISKELESKNFSLNDFVVKENINNIPVRYSLIKSATSQNIPEIREQIKTNDVPYIPGSSIKGAIRTALLWKHLKHDEASYKHIENSIIDSFQRSKPNRKSIANYSINNIFGLNTAKPDAKSDLLKFIEVSDFMPDKNSKQMEVEEIRTYSLKQNNDMIPKPYSIFAETIYGCFGGTIRINPQIEYAVKDEYNYPLLANKLEIIGLTEKESNDFKNAEEKMVAHIQKCLSEFNDWAVEKEIDLCKTNSNFADILKKYKNRKTIRIGFGIGTTYQTIIKLIEEKNQDLFLKIRESLRLGIPGYSYPKTIEFTENYEQIGWLEWA